MSLSKEFDAEVKTYYREPDKKAYDSLVDRLHQLGVGKVVLAPN